MVVPNEEPKKPTKPKKPAKPRKSRERSLPVPVPASAAALHVINPDAAGIDVHSDMHMAMEQINVKLAEVVSNITGVTGMLIIAAILEGERDPVKLAQLRDERCQHSEEEIALALQGTWRPEHLFELRQAYELYQFHHRQITECDQQVE